MDNKPCEICGEPSNHIIYSRCEKHLKCDKCGKPIYGSLRGKELLCYECYTQEVEEIVKNFNEETDYKDNITCPWCGHEILDSWEYNGDGGTIECGECGRQFSYEREIEITYSTRKI